jgi:predicted XRE-type DNA-binding protein
LLCFLICSNLGYQTPWLDLHALAKSRVNLILRGRGSRFSLDALVNIATALGRRVHVELEVA